MDIGRISLDRWNREKFRFTVAPLDGFDERGRAREASKNWAGSWSRKNARADDAP